MKASLLLVPVMASAFLFSACNPPGLPANATPAEQQVYAALITAQSALQGLKAQEPSFPQIKAPLNVAIASYNVAEKGFVDFEMSKKLNLSNPADLATIQGEVGGIQTSISALTTSIQGATK